MWFMLVSLGVVTFLLHLLYQRYLSKGKYWAKYGIRQVDATPAASNWEVYRGIKDITERDGYAYKLLKESGETYCGLVENNFNVLLIKDVELIKKVLIKDFEYFPNRRDFFAWAQDDSVLKKMFSLKTGEEWKNLRNMLTPTFTTGKIRRMMECFNDVGKEWASSLEGKAKANSSGSLKIDVCSCINQYTVDVIAAAAFGMKAGTIQNPNSEFATMAGRLVNFNVYKFILGMQFPDLMKFLGIDALDMDAATWFERILDQGLQQRLKGTVKRNDFLQLLAEAKKGELKAVEESELNDFEKEAHQHLRSGKKINLTDDILNAQSLSFFFAGFSTTTNFIAFALYALAAHQDVQKKLYEEVKKAANADGDFDYDELGQLPYMEMFVCEVLRLFPAALRLERIAERDYKDTDSGLSIPKGTLVAIPVTSLHHDPLYFDNPDKFDPEGHFSPEKKAGRNPYVYLPFGSGPRNCIGMRFAQVEGKAGVAHIVHNFLIETTEKTPIPMRGTPASFQIIPPKGLELKLIPRSK